MSTTNIALGDIAEAVGGSLIGDPDYAVKGVCSLRHPIEGHLAFARSAESLEGAWLPPMAVLTAEIAGDVPIQQVVVDNPRYSFALAVSLFFAPRAIAAIAASARIADSAIIGKGVSIGEGTVIGDGATIGDESIIRHNVVIGEGVRVGSRCLVRSNAVVGEEGFGFEAAPDGKYLRIPHLGSVDIGDDVEIGAGTTIARGTIDSTTIGNRTKIDDQVFIAHNCQIGEDVMIIAHAEISGSVRVGHRSWIGPNACILNGVSIAEDCLIGMGAVVLKPTEPRGVYAGSPAKLLRLN